MFVRVWEYDVRPQRREEFVRTYRSGGDWARLFARHPGWMATALLVDTGNSNRFVTVDRWVDAPSWQAFRSQWAAEYDSLDRRCAALTVAQLELLAADDRGTGAS